MTTTSDIDLHALAAGAGLRGRIVGPDDADYDAMRTIIAGSVDARPAVIVRPADAADVARVVDLARDHGLELAVRSGGHSGAGHSTIDGGLVLDLRDLTAIDIDLPSRSAWVGSGLTALEVTNAVAEHGRVIGFGDTGSVGVGGITTGGGVGYLVRKHGLTIDSLLAAELVTADGEIRMVDADHEPDLFWAVRGGGGNLGVVTRFRLRLHDLPAFTGGMLVLPATPKSIAGFMAAAAAAPEALSTIANVMNCPPMPFIAEEHHGSLVILAMMAFAGSDEEAGAAMAPFRAMATPLADMVQPMPYPQIYPPDDPDYHPTAISWNMFMDRVGPDEGATIMRFLSESDATLRVAQLRPLGGAYARVPADATAYAHRHRNVMVNLAAFYEGEDDKVVRQAWLESFAAALRQGDRDAYVNFIGDEGAERVRDAYPGATWDRLAEIKRRYDPTNLFRRNQNVPPAAS